MPYLPTNFAHSDFVRVHKPPVEWVIRLQRKGFVLRTAISPAMDGIAIVNITYETLSRWIHQVRMICLLCYTNNSSLKMHVHFSKM